MKAPIDNFSGQAGGYARYRPTYPEELYRFILQQVELRQCAWDCGTGNGQVAARLAQEFEQVYATDLSEQQLAHAIQKPNIRYQQSRAEQSFLPDKQVQLVTVAQALHWFDLEHFYQEVKRVTTPGAVIAAWCYGLLQIDPKVDAHIGTFYHHTLNDYWDKERQLIDDAYTTIPFPFEELQTPAFSMQYDWDLPKLLGYFNTWSSVQKFIKANNTNPVDELEEKLQRDWGSVNTKRPILFPLHLRMGFVR
ncbi:class I SAM-dependent methyltransferase [Pontibacter roseus]|uniref:class I SAM-dependent methyltransferase n=1 Tax=Pontibacter roseus TaxID=336989 RepID=UPI00035F619E|nr:class I SAM-dependent methyltransferase [Pontibacter roseus]